MRRRPINETLGRREAIRRILRTSAVGTQEELRAVLRREGHEVTQATLSRDLAQLGARRVARPGGGTVYELDRAAWTDAGDPLHGVRELIVDVAHNGSLVVVHTLPGAASAVARAIDLVKPREVLGTLAGDDTIFVAPVRASATRALASDLGRRLQGGAGTHGSTP
jgi:transcriptional regulator of arginine metabolism